MKPNPLHDILNEGDLPAFREDILHQVTRAARKRRIALLAQRLSLAACLAIALGILFMRRPHSQKSTSAPTSIAAEAPASAVPILRTVPLRPSQILETHFNPKLVVITTDQGHHLQSISDDELLALFPRHSRGLASTWQGLKRFFFLDAADAKTFTSSN
jgi:hypothetical protein